MRSRPLAFRSIPPAIPRSIPRRTVAKNPSFRAKPGAADAREFLADVFDEGNHWRVIAELPGLEGKDIKVDLKANQLTLSANTANRKYHGEVKLFSASKGILRTTYKNGILEIRIEK